MLSPSDKANQRIGVRKKISIAAKARIKAALVKYEKNLRQVENDLFQSETVDRNHQVRRALGADFDVGTSHTENGSGGL